MSHTPRRSGLVMASLSLAGMLIALGSGCVSTVGAGTETPSPTVTSSAIATATAAPQATSTTAPRVAATADVSTQQRATAVPSATDTARSGSAGSGDVCNPCMVMEITTASGQRYAGEVTARGKEGAIEVLSFNHEVKAPRDVATGQASGRRQYQPIIIRKRIDKASPYLMKAMMDNTPLTVTLKLYRAGADGQPVQYYTIKLQDALVSSLSVFGFEPEALQAGASARSFVLPHVLERDGMMASDAQQEEVAFYFGKIVMTDEVGKTMAEDSWTAQR